MLMKTQFLTVFGAAALAVFPAEPEACTRAVYLGPDGMTVTGRTMDWREDPLTNNYARMERDKRKAIGNPNKNIHHKKNGSNYQKDTGSMVRSTSTRQEPEKMSTTMKVLIGVVFGALVAALVLRSTVWKDNVVAGAWMMVLVGAVCGLMYYVRKRYPGKRKVGGTMDTVISALLILFCVVYVGMGAMALVAMNK